MEKKLKKRLALTLGLLCLLTMIPVISFAGDEESKEVVLERLGQGNTGSEQNMIVGTNQSETLKEYLAEHAYQSDGFSLLYTPSSTGKTLIEALGGTITPEGWIDYIERKSTGNFYLGTPYPDSNDFVWSGGIADFRSPNGDNWQNLPYGPRMQCTGFLWHALVCAGAPPENTPHLALKTWGSYPGGWVSFLDNNDVKAKSFYSKSEMLNSGCLKKGDIIWAFDGSWSTISNNHHVMIYMGDGKSDLAWDSAPGTGNSIHPITAKAADVVWLTIPVTPPSQEHGYIRVYKVSADGNLTYKNGCYNYKGAVFNVYSDAACTNLVGTVTTNAEGISEWLKVDKMNCEYYVKETKAPEGFAVMSQPVKTEIVSKDNTNLTVRMADMPLYAPSLEIYKVDADTGEPVAQGAASLEGAEFTVNFYDGYYNKNNLPPVPLRSWVIRTKEKNLSGKKCYVSALTDEYKVSGQDFYRIKGQPCLPLGTITIQETKASPGYAIGTVFKDAAGQIITDQEGVLLRHIKADEGAAAMTGGNVYIQEEPAIRGNFHFTKVEADTKERLSGIPFKVTNTATNESHIIVTDDRGEFNSEAIPHSRNTNGNDNVRDGNYREAGLWFGKDRAGNEAPADDTRGALPYGEYRFEEIEIEKTKGYKMLTFVINVTKDTNMDLGKKENKKVTIKTTARGRTTGNHFEKAAEEITLVDRVTYKNVIVGKEYTIKGILMDGDTGKKLPDREGKEILSEIKFRPESEEGVVEMVFSFKAPPNIEGKTTVVFEEMFDDTGRKVAAHGNIEDKNQTIRFVKLQTSAKDKKTGNNIGVGDKQSVIIDTVAYDNLVVGEEYTVKGTLMDADTGKAYMDAKGQTVTSKVRLTPSETKGTVDVSYTFNGTNLSGMGKKVVVFEELYYGDTLIAEHKELDDRKQTIFYPSLRTKAARINKETENVADKKMVIIDTASYAGLLPRTEYTLQGKLMDRDTGKPYVDTEGKEVTASVKFIPDTEEGSVENTFFFYGENIKGKTLVVFEKLLIGNEVVVRHEDITDENQTIYFPEIKTSARDKKTGTNASVPEKITTIIDRVTYTHLKPGKAYTVKGLLMDAGTGKPYMDSEGKEVTAALVFTPEKSSGSVELEFVFNARYTETRKIVVFEDMYNDQDFRVATHGDITDENQTIVFPSIRTTASGKNGKKALPCDENVTIYDEVAYTGLVKGARYKLQGVLMSKSHQTPLIADGRSITSERVFTAEDSSGKVMMEYKINASRLEGEPVVVFEEIYDSDNLQVASHKDINDENQTVEFMKNPPMTGDKRPLLLMGMLLCSGLAIIIINLHSEKE